MKVVRIYIKTFNLPKVLAHERLEWRNKIHITNPKWLEQGIHDDDEVHQGEH